MAKIIRFDRRDPRPFDEVLRAYRRFPDDAEHEANKQSNLRRFRKANAVNENRTVASPPRWLDRSCKAMIVALGVASVAMWWL